MKEENVVVLSLMGVLFIAVLAIVIVAGYLLMAFLNTFLPDSVIFAICGMLFFWCISDFFGCKCKDEY